MSDRLYRQNLKLFCLFNGLGAALCIQFHQKVGHVGLDGAFRYKKGIGNFLVRQSFGNMHQDFIFPFADAELFNFFMVDLGMGQLLFVKCSFVDVDADKEENHRNGTNGKFNGNVIGQIGITA